MNTLFLNSIIGVCGAGAMGAGIAQVAAQAGHSVIVYDSFPGALSNGTTRVAKGVAALLRRGKISEDEADTIQDRVTWTDDLNSLSNCALIVEAIIESHDIKLELFKSLESVVSDSCILATNTSSLSVSSLAAGLERPENFLGLHFFNPAPVMKLVEVISGLKTGSEAAHTCFELMEVWGKKAVIAKDVPGFIVNRVARPYYGEGWQAYEEGVADAATIDFLFRDLGGFRMGPLELGDLIGHDINSKAAQSVYQSYFGRTRFRPSLLQAQLAQSGMLGRKSRQGVYDYSEDAQVPAVKFELPETAKQITAGPSTGQFPDIKSKGSISASLPAGFWSVDDVIVGFSNGASARAMSKTVAGPVAVLDWVYDFERAESLAFSATCEKAELAARALITAFDKKPIHIADRPGALVFRTMLQLMNAGADAVRDNVGSSDAIDRALQFGVNYPFGPMKLAKEFGVGRIVDALERIAAETGESALYAPNQVLRGLT